MRGKFTIYQNSASSKQSIATEYRCQKCRRTFARPIDLERHQHALKHRQRDIVVDNMPPQCPICLRRFTTHAKLVYHHRIMHDPDPRMVCDECGQVCRDERHLQRHSLIHRPPPHRCECGNAFRRKSALAKHRATCSKYECDECGERFVDMLLLERHYRIHFPPQAEWNMDTQSSISEQLSTRSDKPFSCSHCGLQYSHQRSVVRHERLFHNRQSESLVEESRVGTESIGRKQEVTHDRRDVVKGGGGAQLRCAACNRSFKRRGNLARHFERQHKISSVQAVTRSRLPHECEECGIRFGLRISLALHETTHSAKHTLSCPICKNRWFATTSALVRHERASHGSGKLPITDATRRRAEGPSSMTGPDIVDEAMRHSISSRVSTPDDCVSTLTDWSTTRPYDCKDCGATFSQEQSLCAHRRDRPHKKYQCSECETCSTSAIVAQLHKYKCRVLRGRGQRHECEQCGRNFACPFDLKKHESRHSAKRKPKLFCPTCDAPFARRSNLLQHERRFHATSRWSKPPPPPQHINSG